MADITSHGTQNFSLPDIYQKINYPNLNLPDIDHSHYSPMGSIEQPNIRPNWHQLIIVGNGFDLECGLPSGFSDYINARNKEINECENDESLSYTLTIWDTILQGMPNANWCDIEGAISN